MKTTLLHTLQLGIEAIRTEPELLRRAVEGGRRPYLHGTVQTVDGDTITDRSRPNHTLNLYGRRVHSGSTTPVGDDLVILNGPGAGTYEIVSSLGQAIEAAEDLEDAGVVVGNSYEIRRRLDANALTLFASRHIPVYSEFPQGDLENPCVIIHQDSSGGERYPIARIQAPPAVNHADQLIQARESRLSEAYTLTVIGRQLQELEWMRSLVIYILLQHAPMLDRMFTEGLSFQAGGPALAPDSQGWHCQITVSGTVAWVIETVVDRAAWQARANIAPRHRV